MAKRKNKKRQSKPKTIDVNLKLKLQLEQSKPTRARRRVIKPRQRPNLRPNLSATAWAVSPQVICNSHPSLATPHCSAILRWLP